MSSLDYTYEHLDDVIDRSYFVAPEIDPKKTALLVLDMQRMCVTPGGAAYIESVAGAPAGKDVIEPSIRVIEACRAAGIPVFWTLWGLRPDGLDKGIAAPKWPGLEPGTPQSPGSWGHPDSKLDEQMKPREEEPVIYKHRFSSLYNTPIGEYLRELGTEYFVIVGVTSANCAHSTCIDGWNQNYKMIVLADCTTAIPHPGKDQPMGTGQHWEALRNIQMNYGDILSSHEFLEKLERAQAKQQETVGAAPASHPVTSS